MPTFFLKLGLFRRGVRCEELEVSGEKADLYRTEISNIVEKEH